MSLLQVKGLVKYYGRRAVVNGVDFEVSAGEVIGLLGPNGAGKTTSFRMATGQLTPNAGTVHFNGEDVTSLPMFKRARLGMGYLPQEISVFRKPPAGKTSSRFSNHAQVAHARRAANALTLRAWNRHRAFWPQQGAATNAARSPAAKRRLEIARCLVCEPLLILLDEPSPASIRSRSPRFARSFSSFATRASASS